jgi:hypothetical protein
MNMVQSSHMNRSAWDHSDACELFAVSGLLRRATGTEFPGYLTHEAVVFNHYTRQWVFLPRKASKQPYTDATDEHCGTNLLLLVSEEFSNVTVLTVGPLEPEWGFSSIALVPGMCSSFWLLSCTPLDDCLLVFCFFR